MHRHQVPRHTKSSDPDHEKWYATKYVGKDLLIICLQSVPKPVSKPVPHLSYAFLVDVLVSEVYPISYHPKRESLHSYYLASKVPTKKVEYIDSIGHLLLSSSSLPRVDRKKRDG
jgi:hypothetical protein